LESKIPYRTGGRLLIGAESHLIGKTFIAGSNSSTRTNVRYALR
jgi:hypothetical protein